MMYHVTYFCDRCLTRWVVTEPSRHQDICQKCNSRVYVDIITDEDFGPGQRVVFLENFRAKGVIGGWRKYRIFGTIVRDNGLTFTIKRDFSGEIKVIKDKVFPSLEVTE